MCLLSLPTFKPKLVAQFYANLSWNHSQTQIYSRINDVKLEMENKKIGQILPILH